MYRFSFFLLLFACAGSVWARTLTIDLDTGGTVAVRHNPALAAARFRIEEARGRLQQAGRLANPEIGVELMQNIRMPERSFELALTQRFPLTARLRLEKEVSRAELAAAEEEVREEERKVIAAVRANVVRLLALEAQRELRERQLANSRETAAFTRKRIETAEASTTDVALVELEARQLETEMLQLQVERAVLLGELRPALGLSPADEIALRGGLPAITKIPPAAVDVGARPDLRAARANAEAARSSAALARAQKWQDLSVGLAAQSEYSEDAPEGLERDEFIGLRFSLPLPFWNNNAGRIREADAATARRAGEVEALGISIRAEADAARQEMILLAKVVATVDETLLPQARQVEEQLRLSFGTGQTPLTEVLRARDRRLLIDRQRLDAQRDFHLARVRYDAAAGRFLPRPGSPAPRKGK